jgi:hypothetical protein
MNILRDPVWQFIGVIVALIGIIVGLIALVNPTIAGIVFFVALIALLLLYPKLRPSKTIFFRLISDTIVLRIRSEKVDKGDVQVLYKGEEVEGDIHLVTVRLWNASSDPILPDEYKGNLIKLNFGKEAKVLSTQVSESKPATIKEEIDENKFVQFDAGKVLLKPIWLNKDNSLTLKILLTNFQGEVSTDETRIIVGGYVRDWNKSGYNKLKKLLDQNLGFIVALLSVGIPCIPLIIANVIASQYMNVNTYLTNNGTATLLLVVYLLFAATFVSRIISKNMKKWISLLFE